MIKLRLCIACTTLALLVSGCLKRETTPESVQPSGSVVVPAPIPSASLQPTLPEIEIPLKSEDPALWSAWIQILLKLNGETPRLRLYMEHSPELSKNTRPTQAWIGARESAVPDTWLMPTNAWLMEPGAVYRLGLGPGEGSQESRNWMRILREVQNLIESPAPALPFRPALKLNLSAADASIRLRFSPLSRYVEIQTAPQATKFESEACEQFRRWFSARQLLAGHVVKASNRNKETISLHCHLLNWSEEPKALPFLQISELPLPIIDPEKQELLFRNPDDLSRWEQLERLPSLAQPKDAI